MKRNFLASVKNKLAGKTYRICQIDYLSGNLNSNMRKAVIFAIISAISHFAWAQTDVSTYIPGITSDAVTYYLPETTLRVAVTVTEITYTPGEFCRYAERYLKTSGLSDKVERSWSIKNISVTFYGTPDPQNIYSVKVNGKSIAPNVQLTGEGILAAINTSRPEQSAPAEAPVSEPSGINPKDYLTEEILMAGSTAKMAELTAKEIFNIRESRNAITRGQADYVPSDGESFRYILDNLDKQEKALLQLFNGTTTFKEHIQEISFTPQNEESASAFFVNHSISNLSCEVLLAIPLNSTV